MYVACSLVSKGRQESPPHTRKKQNQGEKRNKEFHVSHEIFRGYKREKKRKALHKITLDLGSVEKKPLTRESMSSRISTAC